MTFVDGMMIDKTKAKVAVCCTTRLKDQSRTLGLLVTTQLKVLASLQGQLQLGLAGRALETQHNLFGSLGFLVEDGLRLTTVTRLFTIFVMIVSGGPSTHAVVEMAGTYRS